MEHAPALHAAVQLTETASSSGVSSGASMRPPTALGTKRSSPVSASVMSSRGSPRCGWMPANPAPLHDLVFILRTGALFPTYRTFSLLEQLKGRVQVPTVLFYPGDLEGASGLRFMGVLEAEHNYRPKIL